MKTDDTLVACGLVAGIKLSILQEKRLCIGWSCSLNNENFLRLKENKND